jgi:hypothetical protein
METTATLKVEQRLKYGLPIICDWIVPTSWRRVFCEGTDITDGLSDEEILQVYSEEWVFSDLEVELEIDGHVTAGTPDFFCSSMGNWHPGDPPEIEWTAYLGDIDVTGLISADDCTRIDNEFYEQWEE